MKKVIVLSVLLLSSILMFGQGSNLPGVLSVKDAIEIFKGGIGVANTKMAALGYKKYVGECGINECWTKNCEYVCDYDKVTKFGRGISSIVEVCDKERVTIIIFNKDAFQKLRRQIMDLGYKKVGSTKGSVTDLYEEFAKSDHMIITAADESCSYSMRARENLNRFYIEISKN